MGLPQPPKPKLPGSRPAPTPGQRRKPRKPKAVSAVERTVKFIKGIDVNPFD